MMAELIRGFIFEKNTQMNGIIRDAFKEHFGFPLENVADRQNLELRSYQWSPLMEFRYRDEVFLLWQKSDEVKVESIHEDIMVSVTSKFLKV